MITEGWAGIKRKRGVMFNTKYNEGESGPLIGCDMEELKAGVDIVVTPCFHAMERHYADDWLETHNECPVCRQPWLSVFLLPKPGDDLDSSTALVSRAFDAATVIRCAEGYATDIMQATSKNSISYLDNNFTDITANHPELADLRARLRPEKLISSLETRIANRCLIYGAETVGKYPIDHLCGQWCEELRELEQYALCHDFMCKVPIMRQSAVECYLLIASKYSPFVERNVVDNLFDTFRTKLDSIVNVKLQRFENMRRVNREYNCIMLGVLTLRLSTEREWLNAVEPIIGTSSVPAEESVDEAVIRITKVYNASMASMSEAYTSYLNRVSNGRVLKSPDQIQQIMQKIEASRAPRDLKTRVEETMWENRTLQHLFRDDYLCGGHALKDVLPYINADEMIHTGIVEAKCALRKFDRVLGYIRPFRDEDVWNANRDRYKMHINGLRTIPLVNNINHYTTTLMWNRLEEEWMEEAQLKLLQNKKPV